MTDYEPAGVDGATVDQQAAARRMPNGASVSRALRRDAGIITTSRDRNGYHVSNGLRDITGPSISVATGTSFTDMRKARDLVDHLRACGWEVTRADDSTIIYVTRVPSAREAANRAAQS